MINVLLFSLSLFVFIESTLMSLTPIPPPPYSQAQIQNYMTKGWNGFKSNFISSTGRVVRPENNNDTVSEGQAYAMLLAVNFNDKKTFDKIFSWTEQNLSRMQSGSAAYGGPDNLLAWHWVSQVGIQGNDWDAAADADSDYAYALIMAYEKWGQQNYLTKATSILNDMLSKEVYQPINLPIGADYLFLKPGNWGEANLFGHQGTYINPSYFSPAWYRKFNSYVPDIRWQKLIDGSYYLANTASNLIYDPVTNIPQTGVGLVPDWAFVDDVGNIYFTEDSTLNPSITISSWDAFRLSWRLYEDVKATHANEARAQSYLDQLKSFYQNEFNAGNRIRAGYYYSGAPALNYTSPAASGIPLLSASLNPLTTITNQTGMAQTALAYILKSSPTNPPANNLYSGPDTFQDISKSLGYFIAPGDTLNYYINGWGMLGLLTAYQDP